MDIAVCHIGHAELVVARLEESLDFFTRLLGLQLTERVGNRAYLRAWQDWDHHTLVLTEGSVAGLEHCGWRVRSDEDIDELAEHFLQSGVPYRWVEAGAEQGQGRGLRLSSPSGVPFELYAEMRRYEPPPELRSPLPSHPQIVPGQVSPRRFDHVNFFVDDVETEQEWVTENLGIHHRYFMEDAEGTRVGSWLSRTCVSHELAYARNREQTGSMLNHVAYYVDSPEDLIRMASFLVENGIELEWGPGRHATSGATFIYFLEPSGNRIEIWTGDFLIFQPGWKPLRWGPEAMQHGLELWGSTPPESFYTYGTGLPGSVRVETRQS